MTPTPLSVLQARAEARAILYFDFGAFRGDIDEALAPLWQYALRSGIVARLGEDATKRLIEKPFLAFLE